MNESNIFEDLFVLEIANNHWGSVERGKKIIHDYSRVIRHNNVKAAIKLADGWQWNVHKQAVKMWTWQGISLVWKLVSDGIN